MGHRGAACQPRGPDRHGDARRWHARAAGGVHLGRVAVAAVPAVQLYGYADGDPVNYSDPVGLCPQQAEEGSVCLDFFIRQRWVGPFKGDGRDFDANAAPEQSRIQVVAAANGQVTFKHVSESCQPLRCFAPDPRNSITSTSSADGSFTITVIGYNSAMSRASPIETSVTFTPDGAGGFSVSGDRRAMPNLGIYQRSGGAWQTLDERRAGVGGPIRLLPFYAEDTW
jgi:hypothetical protein